MSIQQGRSGGLTGIIDIPGQSAKFECRVYRYAPRLSGQTRPRRGRGGGVFRTIRWMFSSGAIIISASIRTDAWPSPDSWKGQTGTITIQITTGKTISYPVLVVEHGLSYDQAKQNLPDLVLALEIIGAPTYTGWTGTQPVATDPSKADQEQWEGTSKTHDPKTLLTSAIQLIDVWGTLTDSDAAEVTKITDVIAAASAPISGLKVKTATFARDAIDGGTIQIQWSLTNTEDDVEMPGTTYGIDESSLESSASVTVVESDSTPDGGVSVSGLILRSTTKRQLHDSKWAITYNFAETTSEEDIEFPGTVTTDDPGNLVDSATVTIVNDSSTYPVALDTPPTGLKARAIRSVQRTDSGKWAHTAEYGRRNTEDDVEQGGSKYQVDQSGNVIAGSARVTVVEADSTPDGGVSVSGLVLQFVEKEQLHDSKWAITYVFGQNTPEDDLEFDNTNYENDVSNINDSAKVSLVTSSSTYPVALDTPPTTPTTATLKLVRVVSRKITTSGNWMHTGIYGMRTEEDRLEQDASRQEIDPSSLKDFEAIAQVTSSGTPPTDPTPTNASLVKTNQTVKQLNDGKWLHVFEFGWASNEDRMEFDSSLVEIDASSIETREVIGIIAASLPATPSPTQSGMSLVETKTKTLHSGKILYIFSFAYNTTQQEIENKGTVWGAAAASIAEDTVTTIASSTLAGGAYRDSLYNTYQQDATFKEVAIKKLLAIGSSNKYQISLTTSGADKVILPGSVHTFEDSVVGVPDGMFGLGSNPASGTAKVFVGKLSPVVVGGPGGATSGRIDPIRFWRTKGSFTLIRRYSVALAGIDALFYRSLERTVDGSSFLGNPAYTCMFEGATLEYMIPNPTTDKMVAVFAYHFQTDSEKFFSDRNLSVGWTDCRSGVTLASVGYFDPRSFVNYTAYNSYYIEWPVATSNFTTTFL